MSNARRHCFLWILLVSEISLIAATTQATTLSRLQFSQLVQHSSAIARVRCLRVDVRMESGEIWTDTAFQVVRQDKGFLQSQVVVRMPGGKWAHLTSHVDGVPEFQPGEEAYLFLTGQPGKQFHIVGWSQGTFRIRKNARSGVETVTQDSSDVAVFDPQVNLFTKTGIRNLSMDLFLQKLNQELHAQTR
jgi:hypothetical protein